MTHHTAITAALVARRMLPVDGACTCHVCHGTDFLREEMADDAETLALFGAPVCSPCADNHEACEGCGYPTRFDHENGFICADCAEVEDCHSYEFQRGEAKSAGHFS